MTDNVDIVDFRTFTPTKLQPGPFKNPENRFPTAEFRYDGRTTTGISFVSPSKMVMPFGIGDNSNFVKGEQTVKYHINISLAGAETNPDIGRLKKAFEDFEGRIRELAFQNRKTWFPKGSWKDGNEQFDRQFLDRMFQSKIVRGNPKEDGSGNWPDTIRLNLRVAYSRNDTRTPHMLTGFFNSKGQPIAHTEVNKGDTGTLLIRADRIYFLATGAYGVSWTVNQVKVYPRTRWNTQCLIPGGPEDDELEEGEIVEEDAVMTDAMPTKKRRVEQA